MKLAKVPHVGPRRRAQRAAVRPSFVWQGVLIVLPAVVLAGLGLLSVRQDRMLALQEATLQAQRIATEFAHKTLPQALFARVPPSPMAYQGWLPPERDPILTMASRVPPRVGWVIEGGTTLVFPPPRIGPPLPQPLDMEAMTTQQKADWARLEKTASSSLDASEVLAGMERLQAAGGRVAALAGYRLGSWHLNRGESAAARAAFRRVLNQYSNEVSETGYPLQTLASLQMLRISEPGQAGARAAEQLGALLCRYAVWEPSTLSQWILQSVRNSEGAQRIGLLWRQSWEAHEHARALHSQFRQPVQSEMSTADFGPRWIEESGVTVQRWLVLPVPVPGSSVARFWCVAFRQEEIQQVLRDLAGSVAKPDYLSISLDGDGRPLLELEETAGLSAVLGQAELPAIYPGSNRANDRPRASPLVVRVHLTAPEKLYARQRMRTAWIVGLIGAAVGAVILGFVGAWRAFRRQQQLAELKSNFVSAVSHELRAPIASIRLMSEELDDLGVNAAERSPGYHRLIVQECRRLGSLIENVLDFSRNERGTKEYEFKPADLVEVVEQTVHVMQPCAAERQIKLVAWCPAQTLTEEADADALQQALVNLLDNAIKHSPEHSTVTVGLDTVAAPGRDQEGESDAAGGSPTGRLVQIWVEDHGEGIAPEDHARIFERFYRCGSELQRQTPGVGLGLAIVKYVAEAHGGCVLVRSGVGQGSRFTIEWPARGNAQEEL